MKDIQTSLNYTDENNNTNNHNSKGEDHKGTESKPDVNYGELNDKEIQILGIQKINEALYEAIVNMKKNEISQEQEILNSRPFNRLLRNSNQLMQAHEELMTTYEDLKNERSEFESQKEKEINIIISNHLQTISEFQKQLQNLETQMK